jgi:rubrerythrin
MSTSKFCKVLKEALVDEVNAPKMYAQLIKAGKKEGIGFGTINVLENISSDERAHRERLRAVRRVFCRGK